MRFLKKPFISSFLASASLLLGTQALKADFNNFSGGAGLENIQAAIEDDVGNHGGSAAVDVDGDGFTDILLAKYQSPPLLYMNQADGTFANQANERGLSSALDAAAFGAGDFDNDGDPDLLIVPYDSKSFQLYMNDGSGNFTDETFERGADTTVKQIPHDGYSVGLVDYNRDGYLDIYVSQWGIEATFESDKHSVLLRNKGSSAPGHFENVTRPSGLDPADIHNSQWGFSSGWADFDSDGWPDLALVADFIRSKMYWNNGDGAFIETTQASGLGLDQSGMGVAVADYDADGLLDFYVTAIFDQLHCETDETCSGSKLYRNLGNRVFEEVSADAGVDRPGWGWGASFFEFDNDGDFDLVVTNGMPVPDNPLANPASADDPTTLFVNQGDGSFLDGTLTSGIDDTRYGRGTLILDYDNDGDEDLIIVNAFSNPIVYQSDAAENGNDWIRFSFEGTHSNRDGIGCLVKITENGKTQTLVYNPSNAFISQREAFLHFGLGDSDDVIDTVEISWPSGVRQSLSDVSANQVLNLVEPEETAYAPYFSFQPVVPDLLGIGESLILHVEVEGFPLPAITWLKNGEEIQGATGNTLHIKSLATFDQGAYQAVATVGETSIQSLEATVSLDFELGSQSVARWWNEFMLEAIRRDFPDPTKHGRNLYHVSASLWDAFWPYELEQWTTAAPAFHQEDLSQSDWGADRLASQEEAISHAAYTVLSSRYEDSPGAESSLFGFRWLMQQLGFDPDNTSTTGNSPPAVGNRIGKAILEINYADGANELNDYADTSGYLPVNDPMPVELPGTQVVDINRWQPLLFQNAISQNGIPIGELTQTFLGVNWREVDTFALKKPTSNTISFDPGAPPQYAGSQKQEFLDAVVEVIRYSSYLDPNDDEMIDISPGARLNNPIGTNDGTGRSVNPFNDLPYQPNRVKRADYGRILAEFWADGPASETPPGHWNSLHNEISESPFFDRKYMGQGEELSELEWDVRAYLALNGAMHDAAVAAWTLKRQYDYSRPITMIRSFGGNGQSSDPNLPSYHLDGLPLVPGLIELITEESAAEGNRHHHLAAEIGNVAILAWAGEPEDAHTGIGGVDWILPDDWLPYQRSTFVTPAFAAFVSGHSTFSRAGAEVMTLLTGDPFFPAGMGQFHFPRNEFLEFEDGPSDDLTLQWATYYDAADQAGISRLYGGIHVRADDFVGRILGSRIGVEAFVKANSLRNENSDTGAFQNILAQQHPVSNDNISLSKIDAKKTPLPIRFAPSLANAQASQTAAIYLIPPSDENGTMMTFFTQSDTANGLELSGYTSEEIPLAIEFSIDTPEPQLLLASAWSATTNGAADLSIDIYRREGSEWTLLSRNDDWNNHELSSVSNSLALRSDQQLVDAPAIPLILPSGSYRIELDCNGQAGTAHLKVSNQE